MSSVAKGKRSRTSLLRAVEASSLREAWIPAYLAKLEETLASDEDKDRKLADAKKDHPIETSFSIGDTVNVHTKILEGDKERIQIFNGVIIAKSGGGVREMFTVRRIVGGEGVERKFPLHSPKIAKIEVVRHGKVRRAKLFYLRDRVGKSTRLSERRAGKQGEE
jgi:large subunit ribosomal protein L19